MWSRERGSGRGKVLCGIRVKVGRNGFEARRWGGIMAAWRGVTAVVGAFPLTSNRDSAWLLDLVKGAYTVEMTPEGGGLSG